MKAKLLVLTLATALFICGCVSRDFHSQNQIRTSSEQAALVEAAKKKHLQSEYATDFPVIRRAKPTSDGRYEVRFGKSNGRGIIGISYYFDSTGQFVRSERWLCDGY